jgi:acyl-coenzyme A thioesterase PaaI-like protein
MSDARGPLSQTELDGFAALWNEGPVLRYLGFRLSYPGADRALIELNGVRPEQRGGMGSAAVNGGVLAGMFDFAVGSTSLLAPPLRKSATVQLNMAFERAVRGDHARCEAVIERAAGSLLFITARISDGDGVVCARCLGMVTLGKPVTLEDWTRSLAAEPRKETP